MQAQLRDPKIIMKLSRLGSFHQSKLSFLRSFLKEFKDWKYNRNLFDLDENGFGIAVYSFNKDRRVYSLVCIANKISDHERSDRVIATKWDAAFVLHDGIPTKKDLDRLSNHVPQQEVGRMSYKELTLSRANKSVRIFEHVVESLSNGKQPDKEKLSQLFKDIDCVHHNAALVPLSKSGKKFYETNVIGTKNIIELSLKNNNVSHISHMSSSAIFGKPKNHKLNVV